MDPFPFVIAYAVLVTAGFIFSRKQIRQLIDTRKRYYDPPTPAKSIPKHLISYDQVSRFVRETETEKHREIHAAEVERDRQKNIARRNLSDYLTSEKRADALAKQVRALRLEKQISVRDKALAKRRDKQAGPTPCA